MSEPSQAAWDALTRVHVHSSPNEQAKAIQSAMDAAATVVSKRAVGSIASVHEYYAKMAEDNETPDKGHAPASRAWVSRAEHEQECARLKEITDAADRIIFAYEKTLESIHELVGGGDEVLADVQAHIEQKDQRIEELEAKIDKHVFDELGTIAKQSQRIAEMDKTLDAYHKVRLAHEEDILYQRRRITELERLINCIPHTHDDVRYYGSKTMEEAKQICLACQWDRLRTGLTVDGGTEDLPPKQDKKDEQE